MEQYAEGPVTDDDTVDNDEYAENRHMCVHMMPPEWCATCGEKKRAQEKAQVDKELFDLLNTEGWSL